MYSLIKFPQWCTHSTQICPIIYLIIGVHCFIMSVQKWEPLPVEQARRTGVQLPKQPGHQKTGRN